MDGLHMIAYGMKGMVQLEDTQPHAILAISVKMLAC